MIREKIYKKVSSIAIIFCLILQIVPFYNNTAKAAETLTQTINFKVNSVNGPSDATLVINGWQVNLTDTSTAVPATANYKLYGTSGLKAELALGEDLAVDFNLAHGGTFDISMIGWQVGNFGCIAAISIDGIPLGSYNFSYPTDDENLTNQDFAKQLESLSLDAGTHQLKLKRTNTGDFRHAYLWLTGLTFTPTMIKEQTVNFKYASVNGPSDATILNNGWTVNLTDTSPAIPATANYKLYETSGLKAELALGEELAVDFIVRMSGTFDVSMIGWQVGNFGCIAAISIDGISLGEYNFSYPTDDENQTNQDFSKQLQRMNLTAGKHELKLKRTNPGDYRHAYLWLTGLNFTPYIEQVLNVNAETVAPITTGQEQSVLLTADINGTSVDLSDANAVFITATPRQSGIVTASIIRDNSGTRLLLNGASEGETIIDVLVETGGLSKTIEVPVKAVKPIERKLSIFAEDMSPVAVGKEVSSLLTANIDGAAYNLNSDDVTITALPRDQGIASVMVVRGDDGVRLQINGTTAGETTIDVTAETDGLTKTMEVPVSVAAEVTPIPDKILNFKIDSINGPSDATLENNGFAVNLVQTSPDVPKRDNYSLQKAGGLKAELAEGEVLAVDFEMQNTGAFNLALTGLRYEMFGCVAAIYIDDVYLGSFNFSTPSETGNFEDTIALNSLNLNAGVHTLKLKRINYGSFRHAYIWLCSMALTPIAAVPKFSGISINNSENTYAAGDTDQVSAQIILTDGKTYKFGNTIDGETDANNNISLTSANPDIVSVNSSGSLRALKTGTAKLLATAMFHGIQYTAAKTVMVCAGTTIDFTTGSPAAPNDAIYDVNNWCVNIGATTAEVFTRGNYELSSLGIKADLENPGEMLALDVKVASDGFYDLKVVGSQIGNYGCQAAIYVDDFYAGSYDFSHPRDSEDENVKNINISKKMNSLSLSAGRHTIRLKRINENIGYRHSYLWVGRIVFQSVAAIPTYQDISVFAPSMSIEEGKTQAVSAQVKMSNGEYYQFGKTLNGQENPAYKLTLGSSDSSVFTIDSSGSMQAVSPGNAQIIASAVIAGKEYTKNIDITVTKHIKVLSLFAGSEILMMRCDKNSYPLSADIDGTSVNIKDAVISATVADPTIADVIVVSDETSAKLEVSGLMVGKTTITVNATLDGVTGTLQIPVSILVPQELSDTQNFDFCSMNPPTPDQADYEKNGWCIDKTITSPGIFTRANFQMEALGFKADIYFGEILELDFRIMKSSDYAITMTGTQIGNFGCLLNIYVDGVYVGDFNFSHPSDIPSDDATVTNLNLEKTLNSMNLSAGRHRLTLKRVNDSGGYRHSYMWLADLDFKQLQAPSQFDHLDVSSPKSALVVGENVDITSEAMMTDGTPYRFGKTIDGKDDLQNYISIINNTPDIISYQNGKVTALAVGVGSLDVVSCVKGVEKRANLSITVDDQKLSGLDIIIPEAEIYAGEKVTLEISGTTESGRDINPDSLTLVSTTDNSNVAVIDGKVLTAVGTGTAKITVCATLNGVTVKKELTAMVKQDGVVSIEVSAVSSRIRPSSKGTRIIVSGKSFLGGEASLGDAKITYNSRNPEVAAVSDTGFVTPVSIGSAIIDVNVTIDDKTLSGQIEIVVSNGKTCSTIYTPEMIEAARENVNSYSWAKSIKEEAIKKADRYVNLDELLWQSVPTQQLPRSVTVGYRWDPDQYYCRYCGAELRNKYGYAPYTKDELADPWKIKCPECKRRFPSNDFGSFYKSGIDEHGNWSYEQAKKNGQEYLKNILYPEKGEGWGVDDGYGYKTGRVYDLGTKKVEECHTYIAYYHHYTWDHGLITTALNSLRDAYLYTGNIKYGRVGAILIDRIADIYPDMWTGAYFPNFANSDSTKPKGKILGSIWEYWLSDSFSEGYDAFFLAMDDPNVVNFLSKKAEKYNMANPKSTPEYIRQNCENGILREIYRSCKNGNIYGNFGMHQGALTSAAVALDTMPESKEMLDYVFRSGTGTWGSNVITGGNVWATLVNQVDRDGGTLEVAPNYDDLWSNSLWFIADTLSGYKAYPSVDLYKNPKFVKMFTQHYPLTLARRDTLQIGDSGFTAGGGLYMNIDTQLTYFQRTGDPKIAQMIYFLNGNKTTGLHNNIFTKNPEAVQDQISQAISKYGEYDFDKSEQLAGYGFSILRAGSYFPSAGVNAFRDTQHDFWMSYTKCGQHGQPDALTLGMEAYGLSVAPEMGYHQAADGSDANVNWGHSTLSHNTVMVDDDKQIRTPKVGNAMHFDDSGRVKIMDAEDDYVYPNTDIYRRTVVMVAAFDDISYGVDFFRVKGGNEHLYCFHALSDEIDETKGFNTVAQENGSYAGTDVPFRTSGYSSGFSYLENIRKAVNPGTGKIMVDYKIKDFRKVFNAENDIHLRLTMLNDFNLSEVTIADGVPGRNNNNPDRLQFLLARHSGTNLDTLFTTVLEPYKDKRYITGMEQVPVTRADGKSISDNGDVVKAVKVNLNGNRIDYVVYATNNRAEYVIDNVFNFKGFVGVYTLVDGKYSYSYMNDGSKIGNITGDDAYTGSIVDFTKELSFSNHITVKFDGNIDLNRIIGRFIYVQNDSEDSAGYKILGAQQGADGNVILDLGDTTLIRSCENATETSAEYTYNIAKNQWFKIPLPTVDDSSPVFEQISEKSVDANSEISFTVSAASPVGKSLTYSGEILPRGSSFNSETHVFKWEPDSSQLGTYYVKFNASDGTDSSSVNVRIKVNGSTSHNGNISSVSINNGAGSENTAETEKFSDLKGYDWAKEAITYLADAGIINGTGENTYTPGANIKRADFAILLVRALSLTSESAENFSDVSKGAYYESELAIAKGSGIITGYAGNLFYPIDEISRQDMMVIAYRALVKANYNLEEADVSVLAEFSDANEISDYAKTAAAALIKNNIIIGSGNKINPKGRATRAETAVLMKRILMKKQ